MFIFHIYFVLSLFNSTIPTPLHDSTPLHSDFYPMALISSMNKYIEYLSFVVKKNKVMHNSSYSECSKLYR